MHATQLINDYLDSNPAPYPSIYSTLKILGEYFGFKEECWPRQETISKRTHLSTRTIKRAIKFLKALGLIVVKRVKYVNHYYLNIDLLKSFLKPRNVTSKVTPCPLRSNKRNINEEESLEFCDNGLSQKAEDSMEKPQTSELLEQFIPNSIHRSLAKQKGVDVERELVKFKNYYRARGKQFMWIAPLFNNWILRCYEFKERSCGKSRSEIGAELQLASYKKHCPEDFGLPPIEKDITALVDGKTLLPTERDIPF